MTEVLSDEELLVIELKSMSYGGYADVKVGYRAIEQAVLAKLATEIESLRADSEMLEWLLPIIIDDDSNCLSFERAGALMCAKLNGKTGREIVDAAMKGTPR